MASLMASSTGSDHHGWRGRCSGVERGLAPCLEMEQRERGSAVVGETGGVVVGEEAVEERRGGSGEGTTGVKQHCGWEEGR